jgi:hypothetical protein
MKLKYRYVDAHALFSAKYCVSFWILVDLRDEKEWKGF